MYKTRSRPSAGKFQRPKTKKRLTQHHFRHAITTWLLSTSRLGISTLSLLITDHFLVSVNDAVSTTGLRKMNSRRDLSTNITTTLSGLLSKTTKRLKKVGSDRSGNSSI